jgi:hypothetical protein
MRDKTELRIRAIITEFGRKTDTDIKPAEFTYLEGKAIFDYVSWGRSFEEFASKPLDWVRLHQPIGKWNSGIVSDLTDSELETLADLMQHALVSYRHKTRKNRINTIENKADDLRNRLLLELGYVYPETDYSAYTLDGLLTEVRKLSC